MSDETLLTAARRLVRFFRIDMQAGGLVVDETLAALRTLQTVEVDGEPVLLAPHFVAQGLIGMAQDVGREVSTTPDLVEREYHRAGTAALSALTAHLPRAEDRAAWAMQAFRNQGDRP